MSQVLLHKLLKISRPRFWSYLTGTFLLGVIYGIPSLSFLQTPSVIFFFLWFTFPANLFLYGINDIFDYETDKLNPKKQEKEALVVKEEHTILKSWISIMITLGIILTSYFYTPILGFLFLCFLLLSAFYSAKPIRAKAVPFLDSIFNSLYIFPGLIGYYLVTHSFPPALIVFAGIFWCMAMHAYSAIPDMDADKKAGITTIAGVLGKPGTLLFCFILYSVCAVLVGRFSLMIGILLGLYPLLMAGNFFLPPHTLEKFYWLFPWINTGIGAVLVISRIITF